MEKFAVAIRDINAAPLLPQPNACDFNTNQRRKITGHEAAL
jgi:hypothetical protein